MLEIYIVGNVVETSSNSAKGKDKSEESDGGRCCLRLTF